MTYMCKDGSLNLDVEFDLDFYEKITFDDKVRQDVYVKLLEKLKANISFVSVYCTIRDEIIEMANSKDAIKPEISMNEQDLPVDIKLMIVDLRVRLDAYAEKFKKHCGNCRNNCERQDCGCEKECIGDNKDYEKMHFKHLKWERESIKI